MFTNKSESAAADDLITFEPNWQILIFMDLNYSWQMYPTILPRATFVSVRNTVNTYVMQVHAFINA